VGKNMKKKKDIINKMLVIGILIIFLGSGFLPTITGDSNNEQDTSKLTFYLFDRTGTKKINAELSKEAAEEISNKFEVLKNKLTSDPMNDNTDQLKVDFVDLLYRNDLIPRDISKDYVLSLLNPKWLKSIDKESPFTRDGFFSSIGSRFKNRFDSGSSNFGSAAFCSVGGVGSGLLFPPIMFPRPRFINFWGAYGGGIISAANLLTGNGFAAWGPQFGLTLGFMGVGLTWAVVGEPAYFGFGGYALFSMVSAAEVEHYPLNNEPVVSEEFPKNGQTGVTLSLSALSFNISDADGDRMSYWVTTDPDIGSGEGHMKNDGRYSVSVSNLDQDTPYSWTVRVSDGKDTTEKVNTFRTAVDAPIISDPIPADGDDWVSSDISELSFKLHDIQGDLMDYTVETSPDIGSGSGNGVVGGYYTVDVSDLDFTTEYTWFVNVTDSKFWTREVYAFKTQPIMVFDPFSEGWRYRKKINIDHSKVAGDLNDFPVLINAVDSDLKNKAQVDGDDILFMDGPGIAGRLFHEIERFDSDTGTLAAWVCIPSLSNSSDTELYIYYGNPVCNNQEYGSRVWDDGFEAVWHMSEDGNQIDSTKNSNTLTPQNGPDCQQDSHMGYSCFFDRENREFFRCGAVRTQYPISGEVYYKPLDLTSGYDYGLYGIADRDGKSILSFMSMTHSSYYLRAWSRSRNGPSAFAETDIGAKINDWNYIVAKHSSSNNRKIWLDLGNEKTNIENKDPSGIDTTAVGNLVYNNGEGNAYNANGWIDEVRISNIIRSNDWYETTYYTFKYCFNGGFFNVGPEESGP
jgi:hypothetical protein